MRMIDPIGWTRVPIIHGNQIVRTLLRVGVFAISISVLLLASSSAWAIPFGPYAFRILQTTLGNDSFYGVPAINDSGRVAVAVELDAGGQQVRQYSGANNSTIIADTTDFSDFPFLEVSINNNDLVVFEGTLSGESGLFASNLGVITTLVDGSGSFNVDATAIDSVFSSQWDVSDNGEVVFEAFTLSDRIGIFGRHAAGGGVFRRTTDADPNEFRFWSPAVNGQGDFAVLLSFLDSDGLLHIDRQQIISNFGTIMDTNDVSFRNTLEVNGIGLNGFGFPHLIDMNNAGTVAFRATLENGDVGIFTSASGGPPTTVVDTSGPFSEVSFPSINRSGTTAFLATFDVGGGKGIFRGPNPITDKIIAIGDVFTTNIGLTRTVTDITGFGNDSHSSLGKVAFTIVDQFGTQHLVSGQPGLLIDIDVDNLLQLTTATDNTHTMMQDFTLLSFSPTELTFDYRILTPGAEIVAYINDIEVGRVLRRSTQPMEEFDTQIIPINPLALFGEFLPALLTLKLEISDGPGTTVQLDNIVFADIVNGDFSTGDLTGWQFGDGNGAALVVGRGLEPVFVPEPATVVLGWLSLVALSMARSRRRCGRARS
jgi:hypothetical protein